MSEKDFRNADLSEIIKKLQVGMSFTTKFDGKLIEALCLDITDEGKTVMLFPEMQEEFDEGGSNNWKNSSIRRELNSDVFMCKLDEDFINHTIIKDVHTCDYITNDRFWLMSHEEIGLNTNSFKENHLCKKLKYFDGSTKSRRFDEIFCSPCRWWLRSAYSDNSIDVGCVLSGGTVFLDCPVSFNLVVFPVGLIR